MRALVALAIASSVAGCTTSATTVGQAVSQRPAAQSAVLIPLQTSWTMPWQLDPESAISQAQGEQIYTAYLPDIGEVRGTRTAIAYVRSPLNASKGRNRTLGPCRDLLSREAGKYGAARVEATSLGSDRRSRDGTLEGPVGFRILYPTRNGYQLRQAALTCKVDGRGKVLDAYVRPAGSVRFAALQQP